MDTNDEEFCPVNNFCFVCFLFLPVFEHYLKFGEFARIHAMRNTYKYPPPLRIPLI